MSFRASTLSLKLTHKYDHSLQNIIAFFKKDPRDGLPEQNEVQSVEQQQQTAEKQVGTSYLVSVESAVVELGQLIETHTMQKTPLSIFQSILVVHFSGCELLIHQKLKLSVKYCKANIQHPWYNISLSFLRIFSVVYEYNYEDSSTRITFGEDAVMKVNDLCINALQSLSALLSNGTSAFVTFRNLTNLEVMMMSQDFAKKDIVRQLYPGDQELICLYYTPYLNEYSLGLRAEGSDKPHIFTQKLKIPELKADQELNILGDYLEKYYIRPFYKPETKQLVAFGLCHQHYIINFLPSAITVVFPKNNGLSNGEVGVPASKLGYAEFTDRLGKDNTLSILEEATPFELSRSGLKVKKILIKALQTGSYFTTKELADVNQSVIYLYDINGIDPNQPAFHLIAHQKGGICIWEVNSLIHIENKLRPHGKVELNFIGNNPDLKVNAIMSSGDNVLGIGKYQFYNQHFDLAVQILDAIGSDSPQIGPPVDKVCYSSEGIRFKGFSNEVAELLKDKKITRDVPLKHTEDQAHQAMIRVQAYYERSKLYLSLSHLFMVSNNTPFGIELAYSKKCSSISVAPGQSKPSLLNLSSITAFNFSLISDAFQGLDPVSVQIKNFFKASNAVVTFSEAVYQNSPHPIRVAVALRLSKEDDKIVLSIDPVFEIFNTSSYILTFDPALEIDSQYLGYVFPSKKHDSALKTEQTSYYSAKDSLKSSFFDFMKKDSPFLFLQRPDLQKPVLGLAIQDLYHEHHLTFETGDSIDTVKLSSKWDCLPVAVRFEGQLAKEIIVKNKTDKDLQFATTYYGSSNFLSFFEIKKKSRNLFYLPEPSAKLAEIKGILVLDDKRYDLDDGSKFNNLGIKCKMFRTNKILIYTFKPWNTDQKRSKAKKPIKYIETKSISVEVSIFGINEIDIIRFQPLDCAISQDMLAINSLQFKVVNPLCSESLNIL